LILECVGFLEKLVDFGPKGVPGFLFVGGELLVDGDQRDLDLAATVLAKQGIGPLGMFFIERGVGLFTVVDVVVVPSFLVTLFNQGLKIERDVMIRLTKRNGDRGQPLSQW
jgi:hypothetical protein